MDDSVLLFKCWKPVPSGGLLRVFSGTNIDDTDSHSAIVNKNRSTSGSGLPPTSPVARSPLWWKAT